VRSHDGRIAIRREQLNGALNQFSLASRLGVDFGDDDRAHRKLNRQPGWE
jgi:hypothetical protein